MKCDSGQLTPQGSRLAGLMGTYYQNALDQLLPMAECPKPEEVYFWADNMERTEDTGWALLRAFRPSPSCDVSKYFHEASPSTTDRIFHPVTKSGRCTLDAGRAKAEIEARAGGSFPAFIRAQHLEDELTTAQTTLQCCQPKLCADTWDKCQLPKPPPKSCTLTDLPSCVAPTNGDTPKAELGGGLRVASTFAELLLLEYANGFPIDDVGWKRLTRDDLSGVLRLHTAVFDLEQRTGYIAKRQGSLLLKKILLALQSKTDNLPGTAPANAKFVAYVGHDTNIANVASMLGLSWQQEGYQKDQTPPAGALMFKLYKLSGFSHVTVSYVAQSLDDMRAVAGTPVRTSIVIPGCAGTLCTLDQFTQLVGQALDPDCSQ